jgi:uncharacterized protein (DUF2147 family)
MSGRRDVLKATGLLIACVLLLAAGAAMAQDAATKDPVTGKWGSDGLTFLDLKFDGKNSVSGTTVWRDGSYEHEAAIRTGSFEVKTSVLKLEGEAKRPDGMIVSYAIEGKIQGDTVTGTFKFGDDRGEFTFKRQ